MGFESLSRSKMKHKRLLPVTGMLIGLVLGFIFELYIWSLVKNSGGIIRLPVRPSGGVPFGPGIPTIMTGMLGLGIGILINELIRTKSHK